MMDWTRFSNPTSRPVWHVYVWHSEPDDAQAVSVQWEPEGPMLGKCGGGFMPFGLRGGIEEWKRSCIPWVEKKYGVHVVVHEEAPPGIITNPVTFKKLRGAEKGYGDFGRGAYVPAVYGAFRDGVQIAHIEGRSLGYRGGTKWEVFAPGPMTEEWIRRGRPKLWPLSFETLRDAKAWVRERL